MLCGNLASQLVIASDTCATTLCFMSMENIIPRSPFDPCNYTARFLISSLFCLIWLLIDSLR